MMRELPVRHPGEPGVAINAGVSAAPRDPGGAADSRRGRAHRRVGSEALLAATLDEMTCASPPELSESLPQCLCKIYVFCVSDRRLRGWMIAKIENERASVHLTDEELQKPLK
jgi:hypothetical protein